MLQSVQTQIHNLHEGMSDQANSQCAPYIPMIQLQQARDHYEISLVMPEVKSKAHWVSWDRGRLRLAIPAINYRNSPISRPGFIRRISLPRDAIQKSPTMEYKEGCLVISVQRKNSWF